MSAPDTNVKKQERQHKGPLGGMKLVAAFAAILLLGLLIWTFVQSETTDNDAAAIDGRTGEVVATE